MLVLLAALDDVELMAGNQSLGIVMGDRLASPSNVIDLNAVDELHADATFKREVAGEYTSWSLRTACDRVGA